MSSLRPLLDAAELMGIDPRHALACRRRYLTERLWAASEAYDRWAEGKGLVSIEDSRLAQERHEIDKELKQIERMLLRDNKGDISDEQILAAREYPVEQLVDFSRGPALAWCHADSKPSLMWDKKRNRCRCFVCCKTFNPIDILCERDGLTFIKAVKSLIQG